MIELLHRLAAIDATAACEKLTRLMHEQGARTGVVAVTGGTWVYVANPPPGPKHRAVPRGQRDHP